MLRIHEGGQEIRDPQRPSQWSSGVLALTALPRGLLASGGRDGRVCVWCARTGQVRHTLFASFDRGMGAHVRPQPGVTSSAWDGHPRRLGARLLPLPGGQLAVSSGNDITDWELPPLASRPSVPGPTELYPLRQPRTELEDVTHARPAYVSESTVDMTLLPWRFGAATLAAPALPHPAQAHIAATRAARWRASA